MLVKFTRALLIEGTTYQPGVREVADAKLRHPHFVRYIKLGVVVPPELSEIQEKTDTAEEKAKRLLASEQEAESKKTELLERVEAEAPAEGKKKKSKKG